MSNSIFTRTNFIEVDNVGDLRSPTVDHYPATAIEVLEVAHGLSPERLLLGTYTLTKTRLRWPLVNNIYDKFEKEERWIWDDEH